ncbi:hypothetical protein AVEN_185931-1 [Araneus ventricosus]|uniref:Uncharacterized protein n=1 Tax=Araneus ventricosus TaxID=182803 RepID=A0A4Y2JCG6_ARAVE|nr:hypothetical protein AVEN_185931-1 [Araneus ventricosus]
MPPSKALRFFLPVSIFKTSVPKPAFLLQPTRWMIHEARRSRSSWQLGKSIPWSSLNSQPKTTCSRIDILLLRTILRNSHHLVCQKLRRDDFRRR